MRLSLLILKSTRKENFLKKHINCHVGIHWKALAEYSQMRTHVPVFRSFFRFFASFCIGQISHQQHKGQYVQNWKLEAGSGQRGRTMRGTYVSSLIINLECRDPFWLVTATECILLESLQDSFW